jgi:hypothetical protein
LPGIWFATRCAQRNRNVFTITDKCADTRGGEIVSGPMVVTIRKSDQLHGGRTGRCIDNDADRAE